jgi:hypothetical protein
VPSGSLTELMALSASRPMGFFGATFLPFVEDVPRARLNRIETPTRGARIGSDHVNSLT